MTDKHYRRKDDFPKKEVNEFSEDNPCAWSQEELNIRKKEYLLFELFRIKKEISEIDEKEGERIMSHYNEFYGTPIDTQEFEEQMQNALESPTIPDSRIQYDSPDEWTDEQIGIYERVVNNQNFNENTIIQNNIPEGNTSDTEPPQSITLKEFLEGDDDVNWPKHYNMFPVEVIEITEHLNFCKGNVVKYICRSDYKGNELKDLKKAMWYLQREIKRVEGGESSE